MRDVVLTFKVSEDEKAQLIKRAKSSGVSVGKLIRDSLTLESQVPRSPTPATEPPAHEEVIEAPIVNKVAAKIDTEKEIARLTLQIKGRDGSTTRVARQTAKAELGL